MHHNPYHLLAGYRLAGQVTVDQAYSSTRPRGKRCTELGIIRRSKFTARQGWA
jgi:hypothetical protein